MVAQVHPDCINASNPYHECTDYCFKKIAERKSLPGGSQQKSGKEEFADLPKEFGRQQKPKKRKEGTESYGVTPGAAEEEDSEPEKDAPPVNVFARPVDGRIGRTRTPQDLTSGNDGEKAVARNEEDEDDNEKGGRASGGDADHEDTAPSYENISERQKKLFDLRMKMNQARMANQTAVVAEKRRERRAEEEPQESRGMSKSKWYEEKQKRMGKVLEANGLDMARSYMLDTQEAAEEKYKKKEKKEAAFGWDVFNSKSLYKAYKKRTDNVPVDMDEYERQKESDPNFYRDSSCLEYGKTPDLPEENVDRMVAELAERGTKRKEFSRRRRFHEEKDVDSINERNEHFNRKIERAFGKYTVEIKNNLERGTALPD